MKTIRTAAGRSLLLGCILLSSIAPATAAGDPAGAAPPRAPATAFREIKWEALVPEGWNPTKRFREQTAAFGNDADPRARKLMDELREVWDAAPTVASLEGVAVRLPGYVVPLEEAEGELKEFLLVPYIGACIHTPPPPANQIVFVRAPKGTKFRSMETVWVSGTVHTARQASSMGASGYRIDAASVERYVRP